jgi:glutamate synthase (ferredoxin)
MGNPTMHQQDSFGFNRSASVEHSMQQPLKHSIPTEPLPEASSGYAGQRWLVEERDACGVGFIADQQGRASHELLAKALIAADCMEHRGGCSADQDSGDGAGIMTAIPWSLLEEWFTVQGIPNDEQGNIGVGMIFLPQWEEIAAIARRLLETVSQEEGCTVLGWRAVPTDPSVLGVQARENLPQIEQFLVRSPKSGDELERQLYLIRKRVLQAAVEEATNLGDAHAFDDFYLCSFSNRTIVYKGMVRSAVLGTFYRDLANPSYATPYALYHRRFSTNTMPKWPLAQPMRLLGHNGEINTLLGNINWMLAKQAGLKHEYWGDRLSELMPTVRQDNSDSANLDNVFELLVRSGRSPQSALMIMVPEAYSNQPELADYPEIVDFYEYYSGLQEPWDGPALLAFCDGKTIGAALDRNGLRPARYVITRDGYIVVNSEAGIVEIPEADIIEKGRLGPGQMIAVNLETHEILKNWQIKQRVAQSNPYGEWLQAQRQSLRHEPVTEATPTFKTDDLLRYQTAFGYTAEDLELTLQDMAAQGKEPTFCMGDDIPLAVLSEKPHLLYDYFKQRFAQVTNPAIDPYRERLVMSLAMNLGERGNFLQSTPDHAHRFRLDTPVLNEQELEQIRQSSFTTTSLSTLFAIADGPEGLQQAVTNLCNQAAAAVQAGCKILILSDRLSFDGEPTAISAEQSYIPPLLAVGAVHHHLIRQSLRMKASLVVDTAQCWSTHHFACLVGFGASAICPYLALESVRQWWADPKTKSFMERGKLKAISLEQAQQNFRAAIEDGQLKILSKMGISLLSSYHGAQIFEAIGIGGDLLHLGFAGTASRLGGLSVKDLANEVLAVHRRAFPELTIKKLENYGFVNSRPGGEFHINSPEMSKYLHKAVRQNDYSHYDAYQKYMVGRPLTALRDLLEFNSDRPSISLDEVESAAAIVKRFCTGGMSLGALSREAHETLAIAMNRIGGKSNSGEGGEDPVRYYPIQDVDGEGRSATLPHLKGLKQGDTANSAIKQIASGRFGVTPEYLISAQQLEIKVAQGAKPGEGGQLPGPKVSPYIAMLRRSKPGVTLISPPPHHDIYSIEDLAQLIFDLHQINPVAKVSVKLVSEVGIGTIAAGVAKANADIIQISGHDGGTGASPLSSIKHAGSPWELGLTEVHRVLMENKLRDRVILRVDGGIRTGWDVVQAALMGAEEYGFGTIAMVAEGCIMARICHTNNCPVGVTSQKDELRERFPGTPEHVLNFFFFVAEEVRQLLAKLGYRSLQELIGRADLFQMRSTAKIAKTQSLNLDCLTKLPDTRHDRTWLEHEPVHSNGPVLDDDLLADPEIQAAIANQTTLTKPVSLVNTDRTVGARLAGAIAKQYGNSGFSGHITLKLSGAAGQSFGAFNLPGLTLHLQGEANDYVGKGMHGGELIIIPPAEASYDPSQNVILGNTCLYGATGGTLYACGQAGERFAVRNSYAKAVIEGAGDHCCEYMTGGIIVVLGKTGRNVGAGMTGGLAYFLDEDGTFLEKVNGEIIKPQRIVSPVGEQQLKELIQAHAEKTGSTKAATILANWADYLPKFWQAVPPSEKDSPEVNPEAPADKVLSPVS